MLRAALLILSGNATASLLLLTRNLLVARLIPIADYGVAATFAIAMAVVEVMSQLGLQQQIVQAKDGNNVRFQAALQGFQVLRGILSGGALYLLAGLLAGFMNVPEAKWAYQVMAIVPVLNAFTHFDMHRLNRSMIFLPFILTGVMPALLSLVSIWPLAVRYGDYRVMLYAIIVQALFTVITSHLVAQRPYRLILDRTVMAQSLRFGLPLLMNGILIFIVFQGDKLIVGRELGMESLAIFAMGFTLTLTPTLVMASSVQRFFLPQLSRVADCAAGVKNHFQHLSIVTMQISLLNGGILITLIVLAGEWLVKIALGPTYAELIPYLIPLAIMQALRVAKAGGAVVALSSGHTANAMQANGLRVATMPLAWWAVVSGGGIETVIAIATVGELAGYILSLVLVRRRPGVALQAMVRPMLAYGVLISAVALSKYFACGPGWMVSTIVVLLFINLLISMQDLRVYIGFRNANRKKY